VQLCATRIVYNYAMRICAVLCGVVFWSGLLAQEARLQDDSRLQETLAIEKPFAPLRAVLRTVQEATGVPLYADRAIADDKVCVLTRERPAHEISDAPCRDAALPLAVQCGRQGLPIGAARV
jgi:hypothetical protein